MAFFECTIGGGGDGSTLTVTCYSGFAGLTISITNGVDTFSDVCPSTSPYEVVFEGLANGTWTLSTVYNGVTYTETVEVNLTSQFYPIPNGGTATPTDNIQTWLFCAGIFDKNYTTISQVLADTTTLLALISSNNAADYMARSTSWASAVCANQTAMGYIGNNDYCANTLLADATWLNAICNSTYFESVLNVKVPTMTSNTTPYGTASATRVYSYGGNSFPAYLAFDGNNSTRWIGTSFPNTIYYEFPSQVKIYMFTYMGESAGNLGKDIALVDGNSNDAVIESYTTADTSNIQAFTVSNPIETSKYGLKILNAWGGASNSVAKTLQFYGRA